MRGPIKFLISLGPIATNIDWIAHQAHAQVCPDTVTWGSSSSCCALVCCLGINIKKSWRFRFVKIWFDQMVSHIQIQPTTLRQPIPWGIYSNLWWRGTSKYTYSYLVGRIKSQMRGNEWRAEIAYFLLPNSLKLAPRGLLQISKLNWTKSLPECTWNSSPPP